MCIEMIKDQFFSAKLFALFIFPLFLSNIREKREKINNAKNLAEKNRSKLALWKKYYLDVIDLTSLTYLF